MPTTLIREAAAAVAEASPLVSEPDWLNDAAKGLLPPGPVPEGATILDVPGLRVTAPPPRWLLATKLAAARMARDEDDIRFLAALVCAGPAKELMDLLTEHYPLVREGGVAGRCDVLARRLGSVCVRSS